MALGFEASEPAAARPALTVSALNRAVAGLLERSFPLVRVQGEICNLTRASSGHWYFGLKDDSAQVRCVMFRGRNALIGWQPREGDDVEVNAVVSLYEARGEFQLNVESMQRAGLGRLYEEFLRLKQRLAAEGLFDQARRPLPRLPLRVGVVTSLQAAALRDVLSALQRRAPYLHVVIYPVPVQGTGAGAQIAAMLACVSHRAEVDVVLLVRGGGSIEDLWSFNEEVVARAIRACTLPVVVGVGHESDFTIADFAADVRAPTPTAAAELVAPTADSLREGIEADLRLLARNVRGELQAAAQSVDYAQRRLATPRSVLAALETRVGALQSRAIAAAARLSVRASSRLASLQARCVQVRPIPDMEAVLARRSRLMAGGRAGVNALGLRLVPLAARLAALDPNAVLARGYAMALDASGRAVTRAQDLEPGDALQVLLAQGRAGVRVESVDSE
ncbi:MAG TPA: exodeoxyribonuclease VII large subunit [Burkholderiaceae bacterium]|nr:exodeoxyribonuclease VII large subunit [Burkholderiaceae bacterium]HQR72122.1 exodeoxyribonuclease VII large subunit [Burkholderiaceae bacterium]